MCTLVAMISTAVLLGATPSAAHSGGNFSAGEPGNPTKSSRTIKVSMEEKGKKIFYVPSRIVVHKGEQIRFVLFNDGTENYEFVLATMKENLARAAEMKKRPHMERHDPNAITLAPFNGGELLWKFSKAGTFEYDCLIPGEVITHGTIIVK